MSSPYTGPLDRRKMPKDVRLGYEAYNGQKARSKKTLLPEPQYSAREFIAWWIKGLKSFKGTTPTCGRIDHSKGYSWNNIKMQNMRENSREGLLRNKLNIKESFKSTKIGVYDKNSTHIATIPSIRDAAKLFDTSQRLIQFLVRGKYKTSKKITFQLKELQ